MLTGRRDRRRAKSAARRFIASRSPTPTQRPPPTPIRRSIRLIVLFRNSWRARRSDVRSRRPVLVLISVLAAAIGGVVSTGRGSAQQQPSADLLILNGKVYRGTGSTSFSEAVAVRGNAIAAVGSNADL